MRNKKKEKKGKKERKKKQQEKKGRGKREGKRKLRKKVENNFTNYNQQNMWKYKQRTKWGQEGVNGQRIKELKSDMIQ